MALFIRLLAERRIEMDNIHASLRVPLETADATYRAIGGNATTLTAVFTYWRESGKAPDTGSVTFVLLVASSMTFVKGSATGR